MAVGVEKLLTEVKSRIPVGDEEWATDGINEGITKDLVEDWIEQYTYFLANNYKFDFLQRRLSTADTPATLTLYNSGKDLRFDDNILSVDSGRVATDYRLKIVTLNDIIHFDYEDDVVTEKYAFWTLDENDGTRILRFVKAQTGSTIILAVTQYPKGLTSFPPDFYLFFKNRLIADGILHKQSNNLDDAFVKYDTLANKFGDQLIKKYSSMSTRELKVPLPHNDPYMYNTYQKGKAR